MKIRGLGLFTALCVLHSVLFSAPVAAQEPLTIIDSPVDGQQLFGQVTITGSATHPAAFDRYSLEYNDLSDPTSPWMLVQPDVRQQVQNNVLGTWNTNVIPDGAYALRLRVFQQDGQSAEFMVNNLRVVNSQPTPVPTAPAASVPAGPTPGASPTSPIQQPPSNNPADEQISGLESAPSTDTATTTSTDSNSTTTRINTSRIRQAFCSGVYLTLAVFGIMFVYMLLRGRLRPLTQRMMWQMQDEYDQDRQQ